MSKSMMRRSLPAVIAAVLVLGALPGRAQAVTYNLTADVVVKTMPDGRQVRMWGFSCDSAIGAVCPNLGVVTVPGPELTVAWDDPTLTINLTNNLPEPVSLVIPGQVTTMTPVFFPSGPFTGRVRSLTHEAGVLPAGNTATYVWNNLKPGTFLYHSGTHLSVQAPMGLYGAVHKDAGAAPLAYTGVPYDGTQATFLFSEVDPEFNDAVAGNPVTLSAPTFGTAAFPSSIHFLPRYFLINGEPFPSGATHTYVGAAGSRVLLRFLNAGLAMRSPVIVDTHLQVVAEDGNAYPNPKTQYSLDLAAGKTMDAIGTFAGGYYPIFDRRLGLTNADTSTGGMFTYLEVGPDHANQATLNVLKAGAGTGTVVSSSSPGGINCGPDCDQHYLPGTELRLTAKADTGSVLASWTGCAQLIGASDCLLTLPSGAAPIPPTAVTATFMPAGAQIGVFRGGAWYLDKGAPGWQGFGIDGFYPAFGLPTYLAVAGDMNGDGFTEVGTFLQGQWFFDLDNNGAWSGCQAAGGADLCLSGFGLAGDKPVTGDWNGDGTDEIAVFRNGNWYFDADGNGAWNTDKDFFKLGFGLPTDVPVAGDWDGDGTTEIGVFRAGNWYLDTNGNGRWDGTAAGDTAYAYGLPGDKPVALDWNNDTKSEIAVFRPSSATWYLDNGNGQWDDGLDRVITGFGFGTDTPVTGVWR